MNGVWPTTGGGSVASGYLAQADATTIRWGTDGIAPNPGFLEVKRFAQRYKKETHEINNGDGLQSGRVQLFHGVVWDLTVRDDVNMNPIPIEGNTVTVVDAAGICGGAVGATYTAFVLDSNYEAAPKQPGERVMVLERIKLIEG